MNRDFYIFYALCEGNVNRGWMSLRSTLHFQHKLKPLYLDPYAEIERFGFYQTDSVYLPEPPPERKFQFNTEEWELNTKAGIDDRWVKLTKIGESWRYFYDEEHDQMMYVKIDDSKYKEGIQYDEAKDVRMERVHRILSPATSVKTLEDSYHHIFEFYLQDPSWLQDNIKAPKNRSKKKQNTTPYDVRTNPTIDMDNMIMDATNRLGNSIDCSYRLLKAFKRSSPWIPVNRNEGGSNPPELCLNPTLLSEPIPDTHRHFPTTRAQYLSL